MNSDKQGDPVVPPRLEDCHNGWEMLDFETAEKIAASGDGSWHVPPILTELGDKLAADTAAAETTKSYHFFETLLDASAHPSTKQFYNELIDCGLLHAQKQRDYGKADDPFANVQSTQEWGIPPWVGAMIRLNDKVKRLQALARTGGLANESAIDSFRDIAVYALIALVLYQQEGQEDGTPDHFEGNLAANLAAE